jgi:hypothetical protein
MKVRIGNVDVTFDDYVHIPKWIPHHPNPDDPHHIIIETLTPLSIHREDGDYVITKGPK